ncbi:alpha/beta hydrolase [Flavisolibacter sp. BT320]|nr:alpha/beta hydrolase [Flavisolibacter longurius]
MNINSSCKQKPHSIAQEIALPAQTFLNVAYGSDSLQKMDIYLPANRTSESTKSLVLIHGGGWTSGSKSDFAGYIDSLRNRLPRYAIFNLNYRLVNGGHLFPTQEKDIKAAIDTIVAKAGGYAINSEKISLLGFSAGAHLALLQAYKNPSPRINAVIDYFGPTDLVTMYQKPWHPLVPMALQMVTGQSIQTGNAILEVSSPARFVTSQSPPTLILHGGKDAVVDVSQSRLLAQKLEANGVLHELHLYPAEGHGRWYGQALQSSFDRIESFLNNFAP